MCGNSCLMYIISISKECLIFISLYSRVDICIYYLMCLWSGVKFDRYECKQVSCFQWSPGMPSGARVSNIDAYVQSSKKPYTKLCFNRKQCTCRLFINYYFSITYIVKIFLINGKNKIVHNHLLCQNESYSFGYDVYSALILT